jgi:hypothetical protein
MTSELDIANTLLEMAKDKISTIELKELGEGLGFNIFRILDRFDDEENGHSAFIAELLTPKGKHGHKDLFLNLFIGCLIDENELAFGHLRSLYFGIEANYQIKTEVVTRNGRIDILIRSNKLSIAIENKIYAEDQPKQLQRYKEYLNELKTENILIYLTLYGDEPSDDSRGNLATGDYCCISYDVISNWLDTCISNCNLIHVRSIIEHYKLCIDTLIGKTGTTMTNELSNLLLNKNNLNAAIKLSKNIDHVKTIILEKFFKELETKIREHLSEMNKIDSLYTYLLKPNRYYESNKIFTQYIKKKKPKYFGYAIEIHRKNEHIANFEIRIASRLYFGIWANDGSQNLNAEIVDQFCKTAPNISELENLASKKPMTGRIVFFPKKENELNFENFNNNCIKLADEVELKKYIHEFLNEELFPNVVIFTEFYEKNFSKA